MYFNLCFVQSNMFIIQQLFDNKNSHGHICQWIELSHHPISTDWTWTDSWGCSSNWRSHFIKDGKHSTFKWFISVTFFSNVSCLDSMSFGPNWPGWCTSFSVMMLSWVGAIIAMRIDIGSWRPWRGSAVRLWPNWLDSAQTANWQTV